MSSSESSPTEAYVEAYARLMELKLSQNRHKGDRDAWKEDEVMALVNRVREEWIELLVAIVEKSSPMEIALEAADIGAMAMMVADAFVFQATGKSIVELAALA